MSKFFNNLGFIAVDVCEEKVAVLADENGKKIPGQCAISIKEPDENNIRMVHVIFEVMADVPDGCLLKYGME